MPTISKVPTDALTQGHVWQARLDDGTAFPYRSNSDEAMRDLYDALPFVTITDVGWLGVGNPATTEGKG